MREVTQDNFVDNTWETGIYAIEFDTPMCVHCRMNAKLLEQNENNFKEKGITLLKCDASQNQQLVERFNIQSVPFMVVTKVEHGVSVDEEVIPQFNTLNGEEMMDAIYNMATMWTAR